MEQLTILKKTRPELVTLEPVLRSALQFRDNTTRVCSIGACECRVYQLELCQLGAG